jgi:hypothetical protein
MEVDALVRKKVKLRKKILVLRDILMILLACLFIVVAFVIAIDPAHTIGDGLINVRYGLFAFGLIASGTAIIIAVYNGNKKQIYKLMYQKPDVKIKK